MAAKLSAAEIDEEYGVVLIDPRKHHFVVLVDELAAERIREHEGVLGVYSNPRIETTEPRGD